MKFVDENGQEYPISPSTTGLGNLIMGRGSPEEHSCAISLPKRETSIWDTFTTLVSRIESGATIEVGPEEAATNVYRTVSRQHASFDTQNKRLTSMTDKTTIVDGQKLNYGEFAELKNGSLIVLGELGLEFVNEDYI